MKQIVFFDACLTRGGAERQASLLMNMLIEKGYLVTLTTFEDSEDCYPLSDKIVRKRLALNKPRLVKMLSIFHYLLHVKADVVFAFSQRLSVLAIPPLLFRPKVKLISGERNCTVVQKIWEKILIKTRIYKRSDFIVSNSYAQVRYLKNEMPSISSKLRTITNYTDLSKYAFHPMPNNEHLQIGLFCRYEWQKNFHGLVEAVHRLELTGNTVNYHIDWYGRKSFSNPKLQTYFQEGVDLIKKYDLEDRFTLHDNTDRVADLIPQYDVLCLPSFHEGFSNSLSEYICCGRPVLCSDVSDNSIMVHDGENGFIFNPNNIDDITNAFIKFFALNKAQRVRMGERSREIAEKLFDANRFINDYIEIIEA